MSGLLDKVLMPLVTIDRRNWVATLKREASMLFVRLNGFSDDAPCKRLKLSPTRELLKRVLHMPSSIS